MPANLAQVLRHVHKVKKCMDFGHSPADMIDVLFPETLLNILEEK